MRVIIPSNSGERCQKVLGLLTRLTALPATLSSSVVCDGWIGRTRDAWGDLESQRWREFLPCEQPFIFSRAINQAWKKHNEEDFIIIMGDDVMPFTWDWAPEMARVLTDHPDIWLLGAGILNTNAKHYVLDYPEFFRNDHMMLECAESLDGFLSQRSSIPFNLVMIPRKTWETIGFLDEQFDGYGCDDDDYNYRIWKAGGYIAYTSRALAYHEGSTAFNEVYEQAVLTEKYNSNLRKFHDKWGDMNFRHFPSPERCQMVYTHQHGVKTRIYL